MSKNGLVYPLLRVVMADGAEWEVQPIGPDQILWERTAVKHKWPDFQQTPVTWQTFLAWASSRREGLIPAGLTWEAFSTAEHRYIENVAAEQDTPADDDDDPDAAGPADAPFTRPGVGTG